MCALSPCTGHASETLSPFAGGQPSLGHSAGLLWQPLLKSKEKHWIRGGEYNAKEKVLGKQRMEGLSHF